MTSRLVRESRFPVGSSASRMEGSLASARAMAARCCSPPESCEGKWPIRAFKPTLAKSAPDALPPLGGPQRPRVQQRQLHIVKSAGPSQQIEILEDEADLAVPQAGPFVAGEIHDLFSIEVVRAGGRVIEAPQCVHERRLPGARRAHQGYVLATVDVQGDASQCMDVDFAQGVGLRERRVIRLSASPLLVP